MRPYMFILGIVGLLIAAAFILPSNTLTGHVITDAPCKGLGCTELCDQEASSDATCTSGTVCCMTHWGSGVCDYPANCEKIREYSLYQSLDNYQDSVREQPAPVTADMTRFFIPLIVVLAIIGYFAYKRNDPTYEPRH